MGKPKLKSTDTILKSGAVINSKGVEIHPKGTFMSTSNPKFNLKKNNTSKSNGTGTTPIKQKKSDFDKWRDKHKHTLEKIAKGSELAAKAIQAGGFTEGHGVGTGSGGPITQGAPSSIGGDDYQDYQTASENLKKRKTNRGY